MRYQIDGDDLCIRIPLDAIAEQAEANAGVTVTDKHALALSVGRELCECADVSEDYYLSHTLDAALGRVIESADTSVKFADDLKE